ncbi:MAG TPA: DUF1425 domain-containing protein [Terricaulis sp.]|nr:DUF1425 domain-containing protein [Terricaulis sp.]
MTISRRLVLAALAATVPAPAFAQDDERLRLVISDRGSMSYLQFGAPHWSAAGAGQRLDLPVTNTSGRERVFEYRIEWFEESGRPIPTGPAWQTQFLGPREEAHITSVSAYRGAYSARCTVRAVAT